MERGGDLSWWDPLEKLEDLSECELVSSALVRVVPGVTEVPVFPSSVVTEFCDVSSRCSDWGFVQPQSVSFSKKRALWYTSTQVEMRYEGSKVKAPPIARRRMTPPTPMRNSHTPFCEGAAKLRRGRQRLECERKNNHRKNETVFGLLLQCEGEGC